MTVQFPQHHLLESLFLPSHTRLAPLRWVNWRCLYWLTPGLFLLAHDLRACFIFPSHAFCFGVESENPLPLMLKMALFCLKMLWFKSMIHFELVFVQVQSLVCDFSFSLYFILAHGCSVALELVLRPVSLPLPAFLCLCQSSVRGVCMDLILVVVFCFFNVTQNCLFHYRIFEVSRSCFIC